MFSLFLFCLGVIVGLISAEVIKEIKLQDKLSFNLIPSELKKHLIPRKRVYWVDSSKHFFVRYPMFHDNGGGLKGFFAILKYYKFVFEQFSFLLNPLMPIKIKKLLLRDCLSYGLYGEDDYSILQNYYDKRNASFLYKLRKAF